MSRTPMICPFSRELCRQCTAYRGRHYYLCFRKEYRGYLGKESSIKKLPGSNPGVKIPAKEGI